LIGKLGSLAVEVLAIGGGGIEEKTMRTS